jgi:putative ABC transport system permease protein
MTAAVILGALASVLLLPLIVTALRQRTLVTMAVRNIGRRPGEAALVVGGALLGTAIITGSFVVGDVVEASFADVARTQYGPIDVVVTPASGTGVHEVASALAAAELDSVDGLLTTTVSTGTLEAVGGALPQTRILELDAAAARDFGADPSITGLSDLHGIAPGEVVVNERTAQRLDVRPGDTVRLHAYADQVDLVVGAVVAEVGVSGYGGAIVPPGTLEDLSGGAAGLAAPPRDQLLVSLEGGVFDTRARSDEAVADIQTAVAGLPGAEVVAEKAGVLDDADLYGAALTQVFSSIGAFSVLAGVLLLVNLFVMLAEERKSELGMLRAVGFTRRRLTRAFAIEGAAYAVVAAIAGAVVGVGVGWVVALVAGPIFGAAEGSSYPLVIEPTSLVVGATTGLVISMLTIWGTSLRIARLNIIRAIRDLPEPRATRTRRRTLVLGAVGIVAGSGVGIAGFAGDQAVLMLLGVPVAAFSAAPLLRRVLPDRAARLLVATTVLAWGLAVYALAPDTMADADMNAFVVQGVVLTAGAVSLASSIDRLWAFMIERFGRGGRGLAPRLGLAYPLARRFRTSMLLGMFSLVIFTVTILTSMTASMEANIGATVEKVAAGYDVVLDTNPASPVAVDTLTELEHVEAVAGLVQGTASFGADHLDDPRSWAITGFDAALLARGTPGLMRRDQAYATDADVYRAVLDDPTLAIVPEDFLVAGLNAAVLDVGETFTVLEPGGGPPRELTVAGFGEMDWLENGALVSREVATSLLGPDAVVARTYLAVADDVAADGVATSLNVTFLANGADARTFTELGTAGVGIMLGFTELMRGFLGLGLLVGIAGLGVVMVRAVRERRQEIGMLRAMGFRTGLVRAALLSEAGLIAGQGTVIGAVLGLITSRQLLTGSDAFAEGMPFTVPWVAMLVILALPSATSLAATAWPASRAAAISPAVALRTAA